jgi:hypothetical protein
MRFSSSRRMPGSSECNAMDSSMRRNDGLLRLAQMGDRTVPVGRGLLQGCRPQGRGRQAYSDVLTAFHGEDLAGPEIAVSLVTHLGKPQ